MATYLQGVTDYIPRIQPFHPDLNFYNYALQTKENQYKQGYQKISGLYGTLLNSPMLRESDITKRDAFFKQIHQEIQKLSEVDLSLEENINTASQIFQPLIDDKNITSDMAYTKKYNDEISHAEALRNCVPTKNNPCTDNGYWDQGRQYLEYWKQDYQRTNDQEALSFVTPQFVPRVNIQKQFQEMVKDMGFKMTNTGLSGDGRYIVTTTNGRAMTVPLYNYLMGTLGEQSSVQQMFQVMASNERHQWINENAPRFNNDYGAAEDAYNKMMDPTLKQALTQSKNNLHNHSSLLDSQIATTKKAIDDSNGVSPDNELIHNLRLLLNQKNAVNNAKNQLDNASGNIEHSGLFSLDRMAIRGRIDAANATHKMQKHFYGLSDVYSTLTSESKMEADPYGKMTMEHVYNVEMEAIKDQHAKERIALKESLKKQGQQTGIPNTYQMYRGEGEGGASTPQFNELFEQQKQQANYFTSEQGIKGEAVKQFFSDLGNASVYSTDPTTKDYAKKQLVALFGKNGIGADGTYATGNLTNPEKYYTAVTTLMKDPIFNRAFANTVKKLNPYTDEVQTYNEALNGYKKTTSENVDRLFTYLRTNASKDLKNSSPTDIAWMRSAVTPDGHIVSPQAFYNYWHPHTNMSAEDLEKLRVKSYSDFMAHYSAGYTIGDKKDPIVKPYMWRPGEALNTGGLAAHPIADITHSNAAQMNQATVDALTAYSYLNNNQSKEFYGLVRGVGATSDQLKDAVYPENKSGGEDMYTMLNYTLGKLRADLSSPSKKDKISEGIGVKIHPIIGNNKDMVGMTFTIPPDLFNKWKQDTKSKLDYEDVKDITVVMPSSKAPASIFNRFNPKPIKSILQSGGIKSISFPHAGTITMSGSPDGTVNMSGIVKWYGPDGKEVSGEPNLVGVNPNIDPDYVYHQLYAKMAELEEKNLHLKRSPSNPFNIGDIKSSQQAEIYLSQENSSDTEDSSDEDTSSED